MVYKADWSLDYSYKDNHWTLAYHPIHIRFTRNKTQNNLVSWQKNRHPPFFYRGREKADWALSPTITQLYQLPTILNRSALHPFNPPNTQAVYSIGILCSADSYAEPSCRRSFVVSCRQHAHCNDLANIGVCDRWDNIEYCPFFIEISLSNQLICTRNSKAIISFCQLQSSHLSHVYLLW